MKIKKKSDIFDALQEMQDDGDLWHRDGIPGPSTMVLRDSARILDYVLEHHGLLPRVLVQTVEQGVYMAFQDSSHEIIMEVYNEGNAAILINEHGKIIGSFDVPATDRVKRTCQMIKKILVS